VSGHFASLITSAGNITQSASANVVNRVQGSQQHLFVVYMRLLMTGAIWVLALLGALRRGRTGYRDLTYALLAVAPFPLFLLQSYGGEVLLRVYLFALPAMAFFAATLFYTTPTVGTGWRTTAMIGVTSLALLGGFLFTRYGNERMDYMTPAEVQVVERLYQVARPGSLLLAMTSDLPWKFRNYGDYPTATVGDAPEWKRLNATNKDESVSAVMRIIARRLHDRKYPHAYLVITRSQIANADLFGIFPPGLIERVETGLTKSPTFRVVFANRDGGIFDLATQAGGAGP
jgi:4-amino-4-deoxy-L-arabinose transferase-like glycosyltransferase